MDIRYPTTNGTDSATGTDADQLFGGIVDGAGGYEVDLADSGDYVTLTFENLNPVKEYVLAVTYNRNGAADSNDYTDRATRFTLLDADTYINDSSAGVVVNNEDSVSFSTGENTAEGYVARWTGITAADGSFSITAVQDNSAAQGWDTGSKGYAMTSIMLQEQSPSFQPDINHVLIISIDGLKADALTDIDPTTIPNLPNLHKALPRSMREPFILTRILYRIMFLCLPVDPSYGTGGHQYDDNGDPDSETTCTQIIPRRLCIWRV